MSLPEGKDLSVWFAAPTLASKTFVSIQKVIVGWLHKWCTLPHHEIGLVFIDPSTFNIDFHQSSSLVYSTKTFLAIPDFYDFSFCQMFTVAVSGTLIYNIVFIFYISIFCLWGSWDKVLLFSLWHRTQVFLIKIYLYIRENVLASGYRVTNKIDCILIELTG